jgi:hypothetical protein
VIIASYITIAPVWEVRDILKGGWYQQIPYREPMTSFLAPIAPPKGREEMDDEDDEDEADNIAEV